MGITTTGCGTTYTNGVAVFNPALAPGLVADWDFSNPAKLYTDSGTTLVSADGDVVGQVNDSSGNGHHLRQTDGTMKGLYKVNIANSRPAVRFDGVNDNYTCISAASTFQFLHQSASTVYLVFKPGLVADPNVFMALIDNITLAGSIGSRFGTRLAWDDRAASTANGMIRHSLTSNVVSNSTATDFFLAQTVGVISFTSDPANGTAANRSYIRKNNGTATQNNVGTTVPGTTAPSYSLTIGAAAGDLGFPFAGHKLRYVVYNQIHNTTNRQYVVNGLISRFAIT